MKKIILTDAERALLVEATGADSTMACAVVSLVMSRHRSIGYGAESDRARLAQQTIGARLEALRRFEAGIEVGIPSFTRPGFGPMDLYFENDQMVRDVINVICLEDEFKKLSDTHQVDLAFDLDLTGLAGVNPWQVSQAVITLRVITGIDINLIGHVD